MGSSNHVIHESVSQEYHIKIPFEQKILSLLLFSAKADPPSMTSQIISRRNELCTFVAMVLVFVTFVGGKNAHPESWVKVHA
jgi:hypothetical protein